MIVYVVTYGYEMCMSEDKIIGIFDSFERALKYVKPDKDNMTYRVTRHTLNKKSSGSWWCWPKNKWEKCI